MRGGYRWVRRRRSLGPYLCQGHGLRGLDYPVQVWEKTLRLAKWSKVRPLPQETPREVVERLRRELPEVEDLDYLGETFIRSRYGHKPLTPDESLAQVVQVFDLR